MSKGKAVKRKSKALVAVCAASALLVTGSLSSMVASAEQLEKGFLGNEGKYYADYKTHEEALEAAKDVNLQLSEEGNVLLKNDGTLPLSTKNYVSVFGVREDNLTTGTGTIHDSLKNAGFKVNPVLADYYAGDNSAIGKETTKFGVNVESSLSLYKDAAVVLLSRTGGEGSDPTRNTGEKTDDTQNVDGWEHDCLAEDGQGNRYKHYLQLTDSEEELIEYVKSRFNKIVVLLNTSNAMEMYNLQNDPAINGILWIGRPGASGVGAVGEILSGAINPSGKTSDEWYKDFSADPTWYNFGNNSQTSNVDIFYYEDGLPNNVPIVTSSGFGGTPGIRGVRYEEGIYIGYKYYETVKAEIEKGTIGVKDGKLVTQEAGGQTGAAAAEAWFDSTVVYPFGYGLSYSDFSMTMGNLYTDASLKTPLGDTVAAADFSSSAGHKAKTDKIYVPVTVTNTGKTAGKQVAQVYVTAPYITGEIEKAEVKLVGYAKTDLLNPGEKETVVVSFNVQDMASFDYNDSNGNGAKTYELDDGTYEIKLMSDSHTMEDSREFTLSSTDDKGAILAADDFTGNAVAATKFSDPTSEYYTIQKEGAFFNSDMTLLSRADMVGTFPDAPSINDYVAKQAFFDYLYSQVDIDADNGIDVAEADWYLSDEELAVLMSGWTQASEAQVQARVNGKCAKLLREMAGVPLYTEDGTINPLWTEFMNQLSWDEIWKLTSQGSTSTVGIPSIDKAHASNKDGPNSTATYSWCDETVVASTWNVELAYKQGVMIGNLYNLYGYVGWYGPGINTHRSPFGGRNNEYYSQDGIHAGYIAVAVIQGCESRGVNAFPKHMALNDQETNRQNVVTFCDEQNIRENYFIPFQMALQEGRSSALMLAFNRTGIVATPQNYVQVQEIIRDEWGWNGIIGTDMFSAYKMSAFSGYIKVERTSTTDVYDYSGYVVDSTGARLKDADGKDVLINQQTGNVIVDGEETTTSATKVVADPDKIVYIHKLEAGRTAQVDMMIRIGGVYSLGNDNTLSGKWDETYRDGKGGVYLEIGKDKTKTQSDIQYYYTRLEAMRVCYEDANSCSIDNGVTFGENFTKILPTGDADKSTQEATMSKTLPAGQVAKAFTQSVAATSEEVWGNSVSYSVSDGKLPGGLTLNATTGVISGNPTEAGDFIFTVRATAAGIIGEAKMSLHIEESFSAIGETTIEIGGAFDIQISYAEGTLNPANYNQGIAYTATGLPEGVSISDNGDITGTPTKAGVYNVTVTITGTNVTGSGRNQVTKKDVYNYELTLIVNEEEVVVPVPEDGVGVKDVKIENGHLWVTLTDDTRIDAGAVPAGADGQNGIGIEKVEIKDGHLWVTLTGAEAKDLGNVTGPTGATGETGPQGEKGETGAQGEKGEAGQGGCNSSIEASALIGATLVVTGVAAVLLRKRKNGNNG